MCAKVLIYCYYCAVTVLVVIMDKIYAQDLYISNLDDKCIQCLCAAASACNLQAGCEGGYCGPFQIERRYWMDSGRPTVANDDPDRDGAYETCGTDYSCSLNTLRSYIIRYATDCNGDGVTNCDDYAMLNYNGRNFCDKEVTRNADGREYMRRYLSCINGFLKNNIFLSNT
ncbi:lysozyme-like [Agrilus planipennis]|uniref:lysozyme n=1 Tax=Agrilus planipennis TaxID=224129 RepID=A0A1W4W6S3_AGRPL|nr:lysozyme-like [Agrilus planipennis]